MHTTHPPAATLHRPLGPGWSATPRHRRHPPIDQETPKNLPIDPFRLNNRIARLRTCQPLAFKTKVITPDTKPLPRQNLPTKLALVFPELDILRIGRRNFPAPSGPEEGSPPASLFHCCRKKGDPWPQAPTDSRSGRSAAGDRPRAATSANVVKLVNRSTRLKQKDLQLAPSSKSKFSPKTGARTGRTRPVPRPRDQLRPTACPLSPE